jgi:SAM-dependent methyltransferase
LVYLKLRPANAELDRVYPPHYHAFDFSAQRFGLAYAVRRRLEARRLLRFCRGLAPDARILDIGCGDGFHLKLLRDFGSPTWSLEGVDTSERAVAAARAAGLRVHQGAIQQLSDLRPGYDLALMIATIEHVDAPVEVLAAARALLRPGGRVVVVTDNADSWSFRLFSGRHWGGYHFPRHWNLFTRSTLRRLAQRVDLEIDQLGTMVSPVNWVYSVRNALVDWHWPQWLISRFSLASPLSLGGFTGVGMVQQLFGQGELLVAALRRPGDKGSH